MRRRGSDRRRASERPVVRKLPSQLIHHWVILAVLVSSSWGCPEPRDDGPCVTDEALEVEVANRGDPVLQAGDAVEAFFAPQGGVFAELDMSIVGLDPDELEELRIEVRRLDDDEVLAQERYPGDAIARMLLCRPSGAFELERVPVGLLQEDLEQLDGTDALLRVEMVTADEIGRFERAILLVASEF